MLQYNNRGDQTRKIKNAYSIERSTASKSEKSTLHAEQTKSSDALNGRWMTDNYKTDAGAARGRKCDKLRTARNVPNFVPPQTPSISLFFAENSGNAPIAYVLKSKQKND